jgi:hypothetical protein
MATRKRVRARPSTDDADAEPPIDPVVIGQGVGTFEAVNGMPNGIIAAGLVILTVILIRPVMRAVRAFTRR